jgi:hypothetical protein
VNSTGNVGLDIKWGVRADLTLDATVNTDFAQVEADRQQINLTRFPLFFPEKRPFFLENAQIFQFGQPQSIDLFFTRRIGLVSGQPVDIIAGSRLSGKMGGNNVGLLTMQTASAVDDQTGETIAPSTNFTVLRFQREVGRSNFGGIFVNRQGAGDLAPDDDYNRAYGVDVAWQATTNGKLFAFLARTDSPEEKGGSDYAGRAFYSYANNLWTGSAGYSQVGDTFNPEVGFLPRHGIRKYEGGYSLSYQPSRWRWIRRFSPHLRFNAVSDLDNQLETSSGHWHFFDIRTNNGGRFGYLVETNQDRPTEPFTVYQDAEGRSVVIPAGEYSWVRWAFEGNTDPSAPVSARLIQRIGTFYDGDYFGWNLTISARLGAQLQAEVGWNRDDIELPGGSFTTDLVPVKVSYAFTSLANLEALVQYNRRSATISSNVRLALLDRAGTGLFVVYNDLRDTASLMREALLGRSLIVKYTRLIDF